MSPTIFLDLGGALSAFGLIFAVYQLRKESWDVVLRIRGGWQSNLIWILGMLGLLFTLLGVAFAQAPINSRSALNLPLTYEVIAYLCFIGSPLSLLYFSLKRTQLFDFKKARRFYQTLVQELSQSSDVQASAVLDVLMANFRDVCKAATQHRKSEEINQYARAILDVILSDETIVRIVTTKRLDALHHIFQTVESYGVDEHISGIGIPRLVQNLFLDRESFFYKHLRSEGLALSSDIYPSIFNSGTILSNFDLFGYPTLDYSFREEVSAAGVRVYIAALSRSIELYLSTDGVPPIHINHGLAQLASIFAQVCYRVRDEKGRDRSGVSVSQDDWSTLHHVARFLGHDYLFLADVIELDDVHKREATAKEASFNSRTTINAGIAAAIYECIAALASIESGFESYQLVVQLTHGMLPFNDGRKDGYRGPFETRMWQQIGENLHRRWFPAATKSYLQFIGYCLAAQEGYGKDTWIGQQAERMRRLLYIDLKPLLDSGARMINGARMVDALLPEMMIYEDGQFFYISRYGEGEKYLIASPPAGAESALEGVNLKEFPEPFL